MTQLEVAVQQVLLGGVELSDVFVKELQRAPLSAVVEISAGATKAEQGGVEAALQVEAADVEVAELPDVDLDDVVGPEWRQDGGGDSVNQEVVKVGVQVRDGRECHDSVRQRRLRNEGRVRKDDSDVADEFSPEIQLVSVEFAWDRLRQSAEDLSEAVPKKYGKKYFKKCHI